MELIICMDDVTDTNRLYMGNKQARDAGEDMSKVKSTITLKLH